MEMKRERVATSVEGAEKWRAYYTTLTTSKDLLRWFLNLMRYQLSVEMPNLVILIIQGIKNKILP